MQRWWFLDEPITTKKTQINSDKKKTDLKSISSITYRKWKFDVFVEKELDPREIVYVTGSCNKLGNWNPTLALPLNQNGDKTWSLSCLLPDSEIIYYRYIICAVVPNNSNVLIHYCETHIKTRKIKTTFDQEISRDTFGEVNDIIEIDKGWLTIETVFQFKLFNDPFMLKPKFQNHTVYIKIIPLNLHVDEQAYDRSEKLRDCISNDALGFTIKQPSYSFIGVTKLNACDAEFQHQSPYGISFNEEDFILFNISIIDPENVAFLVDLYVYSHRCTKDAPPYHLGYHYILPNALKNSDGKLELAITSATNHRSIGTMTMEYLKITPYKWDGFNTNVSYIRHWNKQYTGLDISHRGTGNNFMRTAFKKFPENTIDSFKRVTLQNTNMIEFGVHLSQDLIPFVYNDYDVLVSFKQKKIFETEDMLALPVSRLDLKQLQNLKIFYLMDGVSQESIYSNDDIEEHQPFPALSELFDRIKACIGFNIELKWGMKLLDGTMEHKFRAIDRNLYVDSILKVVLQKADTRRIIFSCFDPDICTMLRYKQNVYPIILLRAGTSETYPCYYDPRCNTISLGIQHAVIMELLGVVLRTADLFEELPLIKIAIKRRLIILCWGDDAFTKETIKNLKSVAVHGVIFDKLDTYHDKYFKENIYLIDENDEKNYAKFLKKGWEYQPEIISDECHCISRVLNIKEVREQIALSTVTSIESIVSLVESDS